MRYVILGTAGHIDHGKSQLVKALTGIDPDRLKEEKERGITIDLGFADLEYPDGLSIGIVDVPGHERLVRNMLAGAGGIDIVLLVVAADEGVMPQSREHLHICDLLKIQSGLVVITKLDLVERDWVELVKEEVKDFVRGSFLEGADIVAVSSKTGENLDLLKEKIRELALKIEPKPFEGLLRLPVDRVFTLKGFGTVVTGTAVSGSLALEEQVEILPSGITAKVRGLQSHGKPMKKILAGQRGAVNLQGVEKEELKRGDTLVSPGRFSPTRSLDANVELLAGAPLLKNRSLVHFHLGTSETVARVVLYGRDALEAGSGCFAQFRLRTPVVAQSGDRYIVRRFSPLETIGGGEVLDPSPLKKRKMEAVEDLEVFEAGSLDERIAVKVKRLSLKGMSVAAVEGWVWAEVPAVREAVEALVKGGVLLRFDDMLFHRKAVGIFRAEITKMLQEFHRKNPLRTGMPKEELRARMQVEPRIFTHLVSSISELVSEKDLLRLKGFSVSLSEDDKEKVLSALREKGFQAPTKAELSSELSMGDRQMTDILKLMAEEGSVRRINDSVYISMDAFNRMLGILKGHFSRKGEMTVAEFRDLLGTTRKYALPLLEYLDSNRITLRVGDVRKFLQK